MEDSGGDWRQLRQGDVVAISALPVLASGVAELLPTPQGVVLLSQTCDVVQSSKRTVTVAPLLPDPTKDQISQAKRGRSPALLYLPQTVEHPERIADMSRICSVPKTEVLSTSPLSRHAIDGFGPQSRQLARRIGRVYSRFAELNVFLFFGLAATVGTTYAQAHSAPFWLWLAASGIGFSSIALLMINNTRDIAGDERAGKLTLAVRLGDTRSRLSVFILLFWASSFAGLASWGAGVSGGWSFLVFLVFLVAAIPAFAPMLGGAEGKALLAPLRNAGLFTLAYGVVLGSVLALGSPAGL